MNILIVAQAFNRGGRTKRIYDLVQGLLSKGHKVHILTFAEAPDWTKVKFPLLKDMMVINRSNGLLNTRKAIQQILDQKNIDLIHAHCEASFFHCGIARIGTGIPLVGTYHRSNLHYFRPSLKLQLIAKLLSHCVAISMDRKKLMEVNLHINNKKISLIHGGVEMEVLAKQSNQQEARDKLGLDQSAPILVSMGHLGEIKGHDYTIQAVSQLVADHPNLHLYIGGDGVDQDKLRLDNLIESLRLQNHVTLLGEVKKPFDWMAAATAFVQPSIEEGFGLVFVEAGACKTPTIATQVGGIKDIIVQEETGILVPPENVKALTNALQRVVTDKELATNMGNQAYSRIAKHFTINQMVEKYDRVFNQLVPA